MLMAFLPTSSLFFTGQTSTHRVQPVQSSGAICKGEELVLEFLEACRGGLEGLRSAFEQGRIVDLLADDCMRANKGAFTTLDADLFVPDRDFEGDVAFLVLGGAGGVGAVIGQHANRQIVAIAGDDRADDFLDEFGGVCRHWRAGCQQLAVASAGTSTLCMWSRAISTAS